MTTLSALIARPDSFRAWLLARRPDDLVGVARDVESCPVAQWLRDALDVGGASVTYARIRVRGHNGAVVVSTPAWASKFVVALDNAFPQSASVTAQASLSLLERVVPSVTQAQEEA